MIETATLDTTDTGRDEAEDGAVITDTTLTETSEGATSTVPITTVPSDNTTEILDNKTSTSYNATEISDNTNIEVDNTTDSEAENMMNTSTITTSTTDLASLYDILFSEHCQREQLSVEVSQIPTNPRNVHILNMYPRRRTATPGYTTQTSQTCGTTLTVQILASHTSVPSFLSATP